MAEEWISKKELLQQTGISYGALYRWKRMGLIPDAWFHRISTFTGQETVLPREKILQRVQEILQGKSEMSLEQMAAMYAPGPVAQRALSMQAAVKREICSAEALALFAEKNVLQEPLGYAMLLRLHVYQFALQHASQQVAADIDALLAAQAELPQGKTLLLLRKLGVGVALLCSSAALPVCDAQTTEVLRLDLDLQQSSLNRMLQKEER